jgi:hypothetical protein
MDPLVSGSAVGTWTDGRRLVQVVAGPLADLGDGPDVKRTEVRGRTALYGPTGNVKGPLAVEWREPPSRCGPSAYAVIVKHITADEMLRIANGLRPS